MLKINEVIYTLFCGVLYAVRGYLESIYLQKGTQSCGIWDSELNYMLFRMLQLQNLNICLINPSLMSNTI